MIEAIQQKDIRVLSKAISMVQNRKDSYLDFMDSIYQISRTAPVIGITGAPGSGKSTFINQFLAQIVANGKSAAVIAVDPSSSFSGGALLGDRVRMEDSWSPQQVFIRSIATRGDLGGLNRSVHDVSQIFQVAGYDFVIIESVGVGQNEIEIKKVADLILLLLVEGMGDDIQFLKAGIMEIADIFILNKIDASPPIRNYKYLSSVLHDLTRIVKADSLSGKNFDEVYTTVTKHAFEQLAKRKHQTKDELTKKTHFRHNTRFAEWQRNDGNDTNTTSQRTFSL